MNEKCQASLSARSLTLTMSGIHREQWTTLDNRATLNTSNCCGGGHDHAK